VTTFFVNYQLSMSVDVPSPPQTPLSLYTDGFVVRRIVDADNHCLFNCVGYTLHNHTRLLYNPLRALIAKYIEENKERYTDVVLGKPRKEYEEWIKRPETWGGAIECSIFSDLYKTEIACYDIQTLRMDLYGQGKGYLQRVYFLYDGIHYDPLALAFSPDLPEECDITLFSPKDTYVQQNALKITKELNAKKKFTDMSNYGLVCLVCRQGLKGNAEAVSHAKATGHTNFAQNQ